MLSFLKTDWSACSADNTLQAAAAQAVEGSKQAMKKASAAGAAPEGVIIELLPVLLMDSLVFPSRGAPLFLSRRQAVQAVERTRGSRPRRLFLSLGATPETVECGSASDIHVTGVICRISQVLRLPDNNLKVMVEGMYRASVVRFFMENDVPMAEVQRMTDERGSAERTRKNMQRVQEMLRASLTQVPLDAALTPDVVQGLLEIRSGSMLADAVMHLLPVKPEQKQEVLEMPDPADRLDSVCDHLGRCRATAELGRRIRASVREQMDKSQREFYLTEQIRACNKELGRLTDPQEDLNNLEKRIREKDMPEAAKQRGLAEVGKLRAMPTTAPEYSILTNYVVWILDLPWNHLADVTIDTANARRILDNNHYGIEKPKERILEYLAVQKLSRGLRGPILCLVGPPGVGKTSLARSVAEATGREYVRLSLGGVRDEAEIRGHRRTYIGAMPGKVIQSLKRVKTSNPLFCLDEIDKLVVSERGDPAAALLEVLDPEQNCTYMDHYLDLDYDLSRIFFITTANSLDGIPAPLLDRMEVITLHSYLETEKFHIARSFLIPRQTKENGIGERNLEIADDTLDAIIREYTAEAGVRGLERRVAKLCRVTAMQMVERGDMDLKTVIRPGDLAGIYGAATSRHGRKEDHPVVGVATGLAWTPNGGEILFVETGIMAGTGVVSTTGKLGEVMQESARAALSYVRAHAGSLGLAPDFHRKVDIHVHVPDGATPKDGPSAGITIATAVTSALLNIPVRDDTAMTGEISLRGRILPVGGLREKLLAARRAGINRVILPADNERNMLDVPEEVKEGMELHFVSHVTEVLPLALDAGAAEIFSCPDAEPLYRSLRANTAAAAAPAGV